MAKHAAPQHTTSHIPLTAVLLALAGAIALFMLVHLHPWDRQPAHDVAPQEASVPTAPVDEEPQQVPQPSDEASSEDANVPDVDPSSLAGRLASGSVASIRVLGDSITAGYLTDGYGEIPDTSTVVYAGGEGVYYETAPEVRCWTNDFRSYAEGKGVSSFVNAGICGFRMQYLAEDPDAWLGEGADVIVVLLGSNDAAKESVDDFRSFAETALVAAERRCTHLVVVSPPNNDRTDAVNLYGMDQIDAVLADLSAAHGWEHVSLLDVLELQTDDFNPDQVHPTTSGSDKLWEAFRERLGLS